MSAAQNQQFPKGSVLVPMEGRFPDSALIVDGYDSQGNLMAYPQGGGLLLFIKPSQAARLRPVGADEQASPLWRRGRFSIEGVEDEFEGWTTGKLWNGWAMPAFEMLAALEVAKAFEARYDRERDCFVTQGSDGEEPWAGEEIVLVGGTRIKVYPIGAGAWIWDEV